MKGFSHCCCYLSAAIVAGLYYLILPEKAYELRKLAQKNVGLVALVGFTFTPVAYLMVGKPWWAALNFLTLNYFLLGFVFVPLHTWMIITNARKELDEHGVAW